MNTPESQADRNLSITRLFVEEKKSICAIAKEVGVTRQRVYQILQKQLRDVKGVGRDNRIVRKEERVKTLPTIKCDICGKEFKKTKRVRKFCSMGCRKEFTKRRKSDPNVIIEMRKRRLNTIKKWQEKNPDKVAMYAETSAKKLAANPEKKREYAIRQRENLIKKFGSEEALKNYRSEQTKKYYQRIKEDPDKWEKYKEERKEYTKKYYEKLRNNNPNKFTEKRKRRLEDQRARYAALKALRRQHDPNYKERKPTVLFN